MDFGRSARNPYFIAADQTSATLAMPHLVEIVCSSLLSMLSVEAANDYAPIKEVGTGSEGFSSSRSHSFFKLALLELYHGQLAHPASANARYFVAAL